MRASVLAKKSLEKQFQYRTDQTISLESYRFQTAWGGGKPAGFPPPKESQCSGHFETKVANETTHKLGIAD